ncbi:uncharacterized protein LOC113757854 [Coffea eugenioides]|uniref:uncharacterized protein LOC113757854 n=1 Tax=Coffea eugenioides TaxID=49369 RepID=UPI000F60E301|nr:uncharacterized protein LOC113757854 [Coffea eugenioides]
MFKVIRKIRNCSIELLKWRNNFQANSRTRINELKQELERIRNSGLDNRKGELNDLKKQLADAYKEEETFWSQKARISWLREGDKNTKYFHSYVKGRRVSNRLNRLQREDGSWTANDDEVVTKLSDYVKELFTSGGRDDMLEILDGIPHSITQEMNDKLTKEVMEDEIDDALFSMNPEKAPGQDGMTPMFFQKFWSSIKSDIILAIKAFFHSGLMLKSINHTVISLIPKILHPTNLKNYRPISLCSVIYKIISKILANRLKQGKDGYMAIKLDMAKAYDRVEWHFLLAMMEQMGFCSIWINWIHSCLKTVSYSFNCNGEVKANKKEAVEIMKVLKIYENASGQLVNPDKSAVFFSKNMDSEQKEEVCHALGGMVEAKQGKEVMLKAVAMAMPTYVMSFFKLPRRLCKDICALMANFWWGESNGRNKMHWISWERMALNKSAGGLGFKDLEAFNQALLGKQVWRLLTKPNPLVSKVLKAKYSPKDSILQCSSTKNASCIWQGLMGAKSLVNEGLIRRIGNGRSTSIWEHKWIPDTATGRPTTCRLSNCELERVDELISHHRWNRNIIFRNFNRNDAKKILAIPLSPSEREDSYYWQPKAGGLYTINSGYKFLMKQNRKGKRCNPEGTSSSYVEGSPQVVQMWNTLWRLNIKHKIKFFIWKCIQGALPVREAVSRRTGMGDPICTTCGTAQETVEHLLLTCPHAVNIWKAAPIQWDGAKDQLGDFKRW